MIKREVVEGGRIAVVYDNGYLGLGWFVTYIKKKRFDLINSRNINIYFLNGRYRFRTLWFLLKDELTLL